MINKKHVKAETISYAYVTLHFTTLMQLKKLKLVVFRIH
jgi:hypothetical protein